jgi:opacity protein-like surface antigen
MKRTFLPLLLIAFATSACAQLGEVSLSMGGTGFRNSSLGDLGDGVPWDVKANFRLNLALTLNTQTHFGHEIGYAYNHGSLETVGGSMGMGIHQGYYNFLVYPTAEGSRIRPFVAGGVHFSSFYPPGASVYQGNGTTKFGLNYGAGIKTRVTDMFLVRFDVHDFATPKPDFQGAFINQSGWLHQIAVTAGLGLMF